jgi:hypothetical protein
MKFTLREIVLAVALIAVFVIAFFDRLVLIEALRKSQRTPVEVTEAPQ